MLRRDDWTWGIPGGMRDPGDGNRVNTALRELTEETGYDGPVRMSAGWPALIVYQLHDGTFTDEPHEPPALRYDMYVGEVPEFQPDRVAVATEHTDADWFFLERPPTPLHPGVVLALDAIQGR